MARLLAALGRVNAEHPWSHNDAFAGVVLRQARAVRRRGGTSALDVGCGAGHLLARLATVLPRVVGVEPDGRAAAIAARHVDGLAGAHVVHGAWEDGPDDEYDLIVFVASLHHLPLRAALVRARTTLRPGGRIVVIGVASDGDAGALSMISLVLNPVIGMIRHPRRASALPPHMQAPTTDAHLTLAEIRAVAGEVLPGVAVRRRLFWRYTALWSAPE